MGDLYKNDFLCFAVDYSAFLYIREIIVELSSRFPLSIRESINLVNTRLSHTEIIGDDIFYHDLPEVWAKDFYWGTDSFWWKKGEERIKYNLPVLKPKRQDKQEIYEFWQSPQQDNETMFFPNELLEDLKSLKLLPDNYVKQWTVQSLNYNQALEELFEHMNWGNYREEC